MMRGVNVLLALGFCVVLSMSCSNFAMNNDYRISADTMDLGSDPYQWMIITRPQGMAGLRSSRFGYVGFVAKLGSVLEDTLVADGMNTAGLTCDAHTLLGTKHPGRNESLDNIDAGYMCQWALEGYGSVADLKAALSGVNFVEARDPDFKDQHWVFRDAYGHGLAVEFLAGRTEIYDDFNDGGKTGFGIFTNEPPLLWQNEAVRHLEWKQTLARSAVDVPGSWYPEARFQRLHLVKSGMPKPVSYQEAIMQAVHVLNTVTVPMGSQMGTDSGEGEGLGDHTQYAVIYDSKNQIIYWRTQVNQNLQRLRLQDAGLEVGSKEHVIAAQDPELPWFHDASGSLSPKFSAVATNV
eukprot:TRINITY_DN90387_c0_g1_i1.p1 TRINITY_DN90387_c0_g1~~TRINITY_DN90387_c0_g1_i1.p1  ORF type:complete len:351 (-),score=52.36 TRINITY_DN90387_c0_g1_i1:280-1332(-)